MNLIWFVALAAFGATLAVTVLYRPGAVTARELSRLEKGMTFERVKAILGEPKVSVRASIVRDDPETVWTYSLPASHWSVTEADYQLKFNQGQLETWYKLE
ncbi:MAG: hypothetical protein ACYTAN_12075 [Planctomycetota bacterium]